eukprot:m.200886 g.200886  ORF g.200886 m.200886 type:complete len:930 (-) comp32780_c0_seq3:56-2845(-)
MNDHCRSDQMWKSAVVACLVATLSHADADFSLVPFQLQVNYQREPALGVGPLLRFSWALKATSQPDTQARNSLETDQTSYQIVINDANTKRQMFDTGLVSNPESINIEIDAVKAELKPGSAYMWTVSCNQGEPSKPAMFVTNLWEGFHPNSKWIWAKDVNHSQYYAYLRHVLTAADGKTITRALMFATSWVEPTMLSAYKAYIDGEIVALGPGRGEANVLLHNNTFLHAPYTTTDITPFLKPRSVIAVQGMAPLFSTPCNLHACKDTNTAGGGVLIQLMLTFSDGSTTTIATGDSDWTALAVDDYYNPTTPNVSVPGLNGETAYAKALEQIDARKEVIGWMTQPTVTPMWPAAVASPYQAKENLVAKMARPLQVYKPPSPTITRNQSDVTAFFVDFGRELQGGVILDVGDGVAGTMVNIISGELLLLNGSTDSSTGSRIDPSNTWGYDFNWTLRDGEQQIVQHNYMLFRYLSVRFVQGEVPTTFSVSAWGVKYEYIDTDSSFISDNATLNAVHELARWTLDGGVVDTYTDSNTRERRPYECDGMIAASGRALIQNDAMWGRHSHSWVLEVPTWPVEWMQMASLLAWHDYQATASVDVFATYEQRLYERTNVGAVDNTSLVNTAHGRHLVGWDPPPTKEMFVNNDHTSVCNGWTIHGLEALSTMAAVGGNQRNATIYNATATLIRRAMLASMWDSSQKRFCDGPCNDSVVNNHGGVTTNYFTTYFGLVPEESKGAVWQQIADAGLTGIGDYGAFVFVNALAMHPVDDGTAMLTALTKCDAFSWCNEMKTYNATMTTESLGVPHATMSHPWGTAPLPAIVHGIMGIQQTSPAWATFTVKPLIGSLSFANITVPTIRGPIVVAATQHNLTVSFPCNTRAKLCLYNGDFTQASDERKTLLLDGNAIVTRIHNQFVCTTTAIGCGVKPRFLMFA